MNLFYIIFLIGISHCEYDRFYNPPPCSLNDFLTILLCNSKLQMIQEKLTEIYSKNKEYGNNWEELNTMCESWKNCTQHVCGAVKDKVQFVGETCDFMKFFVSPEFTKCIGELNKNSSSCFINYINAPQTRNKEKKCEIFKNKCMEEEVAQKCSKRLAERFEKSQNLRISLEKC
ncbi:unnamed protein product [Caenorhabditis angaria]|uniref:T20D4.11-like domain-containing protein n=1 Tax=Caenorhabditis angaria TaxID=860376 RepID=A0A9P1IU96_9PELO|nr:unnamed protein product [Caenorhabditis angaria]